MAFTTHRPAPSYVLTNVANGQIINAAAINGVVNSMKHFAQRGRLQCTAPGMRVNQHTIPVVGVVFPDLPTFKLSRYYVSIPVTIAPHDTHFNMFFTYRCNPYQPYTNPVAVVGLDCDIELVQAGSAYPLAVASFSEFLPPNSTTPVPPNPYYNFRFVAGSLPNGLSLSLTEPTQCYIRIYADFTARYELDGTEWVDTGSYDAAIDDDVQPWPNLATFWNGIGSLLFSTYKPCEGC